MTTANPFIVGLDIDDTLSPYTQKFMERLAQENKIDVAQMRKPETYDMWGYGWDGIETFDQFIAKHNQFVREGFFSSMPVFDHVAETISELREAGAYVKIITTRFCSPDPKDKALVISETAQFLVNNDLEYDEFMISSTKDDIFADVYVDDSPNNIRKFVQAKRHAILPDTVLHTPKTAKQYNLPLMTGGWAKGKEMLLEMNEAHQMKSAGKIYVTV